MGSFGKFVGGLLFGAVVGAGVIVFTTPKTGDETRNNLVLLWDNAMSSGRQAAKEREAELWAEFNARVVEGDTALVKV